VPGRAIFELPLGRWRFSVKGSYSSPIEDEVDESCSVVVRFSVDFVKARRTLA
jgi:hypothetical protein